jgi:TrmH family RNA methyltransferase
MNRRFPEQEGVTSPANPRIKAAVRLRKRRERDATGLVLIEGIRELSRALEGHITIEECFYEPTLAATAEGKRLEREIASRGITATAVAARVFEKLAYREGSGGFVAVARRPRRSLHDLPSCENPLLLVVDGVEKPGNIGAVLRSADAAGAAGLIVSDPKTDLYNPNVIRASLGTVFTTPAVCTSARDAALWLEKNGVSVFTATPFAALPYTEADYTGATALVVGSEDRGVGGRWLGPPAIRVRIPMMGCADSLNVSAAATILLYEALRQRTPKR